MSVKILTGDCRDILPTLPDASVHCCVTSPPYWGLRDYGVGRQIGLESSPDAYVAEMVAVFSEVRRVLRDDGTLWLNLGDSYSHGGSGARDEERWPKQSRNAHGATIHAKANAGLKPKDLIGIPWRVAFALQADGWYLRQDIIWAKPNPMPESVTDRCTKAHEYIFLLSKSARYYFDAGAVKEPQSEGTFERFGNGKAPRKVSGKALIAEPGRVLANADYKNATPDAIMPDGMRNKRSVWTVATQPFSEAHFATFPPALIEPCILAGCPKGGTVFDPFGGAGTTGLVADRLGRNAILIDLNPQYAEMAERRIENDCPMFASVTA